MASKRLSLRSRIFVYMILLVLVASVLIAAVTLFQYNEQSKDYHKQRLERKETHQRVQEWQDPMSERIQCICFHQHPKRKRSS